MSDIKKFAVSTDSTSDLYAEEIKNFLAFLPAPVSVLKLTDLMINRELSNNSNRQKNCDLGNVNKQVEASAKQIDAINKIKNMGAEGRCKHPCIGQSKSDLTIAGCAIIEALTTFWPISEITVADRGIREGILLDLMHSKRIQHNHHKKKRNRFPLARGGDNGRFNKKCKQ